jgi:hypothetical protein
MIVAGEIKVTMMNNLVFGILCLVLILSFDPTHQELHDHTILKSCGLSIPKNHEDRDLRR